MPYKSDKQRRFMHAKHPDIARRWDSELGKAKQNYARKQMNKKQN